MRNELQMSGVCIRHLTLKTFISIPSAIKKKKQFKKKVQDESKQEQETCT